MRLPHRIVITLLSLWLLPLFSMDGTGMCNDRKASPSPSLLLNIDCTNFFHGKSPDQMTGAMLDAYADSILQSGATVLLINTQAERANYNSRVFEPFWQGYDPEKGLDQDIFNGLPPGKRQNWHRLVSCMVTLHDRGVDYPARLIERCRQTGVSPWISLRMNDIHNNDNIQHPGHSTFWQQHPECWRVTDRKVDYYDRALDYACQAVRDRYLALIDETLNRYDVEGLELDFLREPYVFRMGREAEHRDLMTAWIDTVQQRVTAAERKRGHAIALGVRVPASPETSRELGLDAVTWAQKGLVDLIVVSPRWATLDNELPLHIWKHLLRGTHVKLAGGLEVRYQPYPDGPAERVSPKVASGAAMSILSGGGDAVYLFNYFFMHFHGTEWTLPVFRSRLQAMREMDPLDQMSRVHVVTYADVTAHGEVAATALPSRAARHLFRLSTGPSPLERTCTVLLTTEREYDPPPSLRVNSVACPLITSRQDTLLYSVPESARAPENHVLEVVSDDGRPFGVTRVEFHIDSRSSVLKP
jgi:hypothetical protein